MGKAPAPAPEKVTPDTQGDTPEGETVTPDTQGETVTSTPTSLTAADALAAYRAMAPRNADAIALTMGAVTAAAAAATPEGDGFTIPQDWQDTIQYCRSTLTPAGDKGIRADAPGVLVNDPTLTPALGAMVKLLTSPQPARQGTSTPATPQDWTDAAVIVTLFTLASVMGTDPLALDPSLPIAGSVGGSDRARAMGAAALTAMAKAAGIRATQGDGTPATRDTSRRDARDASRLVGHTFTLTDGGQPVALTMTYVPHQGEGQGQPFTLSDGQKFGAPSPAMVAALGRKTDRNGWEGWVAPDGRTLDMVARDVAPEGDTPEGDTPEGDTPEGDTQD